MPRFAVACALTLALISGAGRADESQPAYRRFGLKLDAGAPDVAALSAIFRPVEFMRLELGGATSFAAPGIRGGVAVFYPWAVSPVLAIDAGRMFTGDYSGWARRFSNSVQEKDLILLKNADYTYVNFHTGLEFGSTNRFQFFLHGGMTYLTTQTHGLQAFIRAQANDQSLTTQEASLRIWAPSAKLGFILYLL